MATAKKSIFTLGQYPAIFRSARGNVTAQGDFFKLKESGADILSVRAQDGLTLGWAHASIIAAVTTAIATSITFTVGVADALAVGDYLEVAGTGEMLQVAAITTADSGVSGTVTVRRGGLGTTAAVIGATTLLYIKNTISFSDVAPQDGIVAVHYVPSSYDFYGVKQE